MTVADHEDAAWLCAVMVLRSMRARSDAARKSYVAAAQFFALAAEQIERGNNKQRNSEKKGDRR